MVNCNFGMAFFKAIVKSSERELMEYNGLSEERKINIISKFWANMVKFILLNKLSESYWKEPESKDREVISYLFPDLPADAIVLKGKKQDDKAYLAFTVSFNENLCSAEIMPYVVAKDKATEEHLVDKVSQNLITVEKFLSRKITKEMAIKFCFETLYSQDVCNVWGDEAVIMYKIMLRANRHYPKFAELSAYEKRKILAEAYRKGMQRSARERDAYTFARATFEVFESTGLANILYKYDPNLNKYKTFERCGRSPYYIPGSACPRFITYKFQTKSGAEIRTSFLPFDLWELLAKAETANVTV